MEVTRWNLLWSYTTCRNIYTSQANLSVTAVTSGRKITSWPLSQPQSSIIRALLGHPHSSQRTHVKSVFFGTATTCRKQRESSLGDCVLCNASVVVKRSRYHARKPDEIFSSSVRSDRPLGLHWLSTEKQAFLLSDRGTSRSCRALWQKSGSRTYWSAQ